ncbi:diaminopimelate epimerase [Methanosphaera sp. Vir-13MRS]|jgi:diaminopimelate epimerase|uniref:diaminopimelate epimerase n=1 Tax=Candidatus Methanosphaera massiliense TaxID=3017187 RepID=UPI00238040A6|nr:diaminopimelate epimerase [Candidatus Methanosphaera massiliense]MDD6285877.1 diaminopimelate epimerase [Methanobacteriaceae archaeon]MDE4077958.1 diaminopimelate epimerase [Candidatus Methanosphaera massiliense]
MMKEIEFTKMHALGNDYIVINETEQEVIPEQYKNKLSDDISTRRFSVGSDGVIFACKSAVADVRFRIFNSDGSEAEMCGNGIRCLAKYVYDNDIVKKETMQIETMEDIKEARLTVEDGEVTSIAIDMGKGYFKPEEIPAIAPSGDTEEFIDEEIDVEGEKVIMSSVSVGNPHAVCFTDVNIDDIDLDYYGPRIENHEAFPEKVNVHFVNIISPEEINILTWERGAGFTFACGTGTTSCVLLGYKMGLLNEKVHAHLSGGDLDITITEHDDFLTAVMEGKAITVYEANMTVEL